MNAKVLEKLVDFFGFGLKGITTERTPFLSSVRGATRSYSKSGGSDTTKLSVTPLSFVNSPASDSSTYVSGTGGSASTMLRKDCFPAASSESTVWRNGPAYTKRSKARLRTRTFSSATPGSCARNNTLSPTVRTAGAGVGIGVLSGRGFLVPLPL
jgi:hypothetical protein